MAEEGIITWTFPLGTWVRHQAFNATAVFITVWREYRETPWGTREQYGLMDIADMDLDLRDSRLALEVGEADELTSYDEDPGGEVHTAEQAAFVADMRRRHAGEVTDG